ncbi:unnamed protein product [Calicophoron daubneyi]|uniref:Protein SMG9 n=1 Tax=Calicophoron daubneyi TaxID=300641 RepID=A0AAV2TSN9_CALDB
MASGALSELFRQLKWMFVKNGPGFTGTHHSVELTKLCAVMKEDTPPKSILDFFGSPLKEQELFDAENNADELYALCDDPMQIPVKLVDDQLRFTDLTDIQDLFVENTGFLVVGVIGLQGSGKSSLLNILANQLPNDASLLDGPFAVQSIKNILTNSPETGGIDLYITQDRIILLDTQPLLSFSLTNYHSQNASSVSGAQMDIAPATPGSNSTVSTLTGPGNWSLDVWAELSSIQVVAFLLNVCHVVVVVNNDLSSKSMQLYRLIDRAAGLKPTVYTLSVMPNLIDIRRHSRESRLLKMENRRELRPGGLNKVSCMNAVRSEEPCRNDDSSSDSDQEDLGGIQNANKAADRGIPDMQDVLVTPSGLLHPRQHRQQHRQCSIEADSADVTDALNRLKVSSPETNVTTDATSDSVGLQKYSVRKSAESSNKSEKEISPQLEVGPQPALSANSATHQSGPSEAEIVTECCSVLEAVESELCDMLRSLPHPNARTSKSPQILDSESASDEDDSNVENGVLDGEKLNAKLTKMTHYVQSIRRRFFDLQERLNRPRLFLVPEVDDEANTPVGCPTYADSVRLLQEAIISTPRQHMMPNFTEKKWIAYAQKMWDAVCSSPLLLDYHSVLINQL